VRRLARWQRPIAAGVADRDGAALRRRRAGRRRGSAGPGSDWHRLCWMEVARKRLPRTTAEAAGAPGAREERRPCCG
jgi:hypothetical protein